jgi:DNA-binding transcriptional regulator LsrR (DeoR family)
LNTHRLNGIFATYRQEALTNMSTDVSSQTKAELVFKIAQKVYVEGKKQRQVARELGISSPSTVSRLLTHGWETGILTLGYNPAAGRNMERNKALETALGQSFQLQNAIVIHFPYPSEYTLEVDNRLHENLGRALANHLKIILRSGDHIGVGGGRANYETAKALHEQGPLPLRGIKVTSMIGRLSRLPHQDPTQSSHAIDADDVVFMMAASFQEAVRQPVSMNLALPSPDIVAQLKETSPGILLAEEKWDQEPDRFVPDIVLSGVGSLGPESDHTFRHLDAPAIVPVREPLEKLLDLIGPECCLVGDLVGRLFFVPPPPGVHIEGDVEDTVKDLIEEINDRLLCITPDQLRKVNKVIVAAGGPFKVDALFTLLSMPNAITHELCTDEQTAQKLLARKESSDV